MEYYINREDTIARIQKMASLVGFENPSVAIDCAIRCIRHTPVANVAPVVRGRWIVKKNYHHGHYVDTTCFCSECNTLGSPQWKGCPVCLARMGGE